MLNDDKYRVGDMVKIQDNRFIETHITPRWAYGYSGTVIRVNKLSYTVKLYNTDWQCRVNEEDMVLIERGADCECCSEAEQVCCHDHESQMG